MAMVISRLGDDAATANALPSGGTNELFLKVFAGEVLTTFEENNVMMPLHRVRSISSGKSAQFPVTGVAAARYHQPGESVYQDAALDGQAGEPNYLSSIAHAERIIYIDDLLISGTFIGSLDEAKNHYDVRSIYSTEIGRQLAYTADKNLMRVVIAAARKTEDRFGGTNAKYLGGQIDIGNGGEDAGEEFIDGLFSAAQKMDEADVPSNDRFCVVGPELYYKLVNENKDAINRDYGNEGNGSIANPGVTMSVAGIRVMKSNHLPTLNESSTQDVLAGAPGVMNDTAGVDATAGAGTAGSGYSGQDYLEAAGTIKAICFQSEGVGTVKLLDLAMESEYSVERQGTLLLAKYAMGHGALREECCWNLIY